MNGTRVGTFTLNNGNNDTNKVIKSKILLAFIFKTRILYSKEFKNHQNQEDEMRKGKMMLARKVWLHTGGSQCSYCGAEIKISTIKDHTNWAIEDPKGQYGVDVCAQHNPKRLDKWLSKMFFAPITVVIETGSL